MRYGSTVCFLPTSRADTSARAPLAPQAAWRADAGSSGDSPTGFTHTPPPPPQYSFEYPFLLSTPGLSPPTEPAQQAQSHCCASAQQSHLSFRSNLTAAQLQSHFAPHGAKLKKYLVPAGECPPNLIAPAWGRNSIGRVVKRARSARAPPALHQIII